MKKWQIVALAIIALCIPALIVGYSFGLFKFFAPKYQDVKRDIFENTKSYMHGVQQDLGKYYEEYNSGDAGKRETIASVIKMRFAEVDANKIQNPKLRAFLISTRGY